MPARALEPAACSRSLKPPSALGHLTATRQRSTLPSLWRGSSEPASRSRRADKASRVPEGTWVKCPDCGQALFNKDLAGNLHVCPKCAHHFRLGSLDRLRMLFDGDWVEHDRRPALDRSAQLHRHQALHAAPQGRRRRDRPARRHRLRHRAASTASRPASRRWSTASSAAAWASWSARRSRGPSSGRSSAGCRSSSSRARAAPA